ncbi:MAG: 2-iminoacetate synthase ThiH [Fibrobacterota bacterium]
MNNISQIIPDWYADFSKIPIMDFETALRQKNFSPAALQSLLSPQAGEHLEEMARMAQLRKQQYFGNTVTLFTPLYLSNYCTNGCIYCAFKADNAIRRHQLTPEQIRTEGEEIGRTGMRHLLVLTGEAPSKTPFSYIKESLLLLSEQFSSLSIEMYPMSEIQYADLVAAVPVEGVTVYQETYNPRVYDRVHPYGEKRNYSWRLKTADRAARAGVRSITVGALLGLDDPLYELGALALHLDYLTKKYPQVSLLVSFPRLRPISGSGFSVPHSVSHRFFTQIVCAFRILFPHVGITMSTRESERIRNGLVPLGVTKMSAGVSTAVGSASENSDEQFEIADERSLQEVCSWLREHGYQPVMHDWNKKLTP